MLSLLRLVFRNLSWFARLFTFLQTLIFTELREVDTKQCETLIPNFDHQFLTLIPKLTFTELREVSMTAFAMGILPFWRPVSVHFWDFKFALIFSFIMPLEYNSRASSFCPVCLWLNNVTLWQKKNFNLGHNFWTVRDKDFVFDMHTLQMKPC